MDVSNVYGMYLDFDHINDPGANSPPLDRDYAIQTIAAHQPEIAIFIDQNSGIVTMDDVWIYEYVDDSWQNPYRLSDIDGSALYSDATYIEFQMPIDTIIDAGYSGSIAMMVFSIEVGAGNSVVDSVPEDPEVPGAGLVSRFTSVSEQINWLYPAISNTTPHNHSDLGPFSWDYPTGADPSGISEDPPSPWAGNRDRE